MVDFESVGKIVTLILIITGSLMTAVIANADAENFGFTENLALTTIQEQNDNMQELIDQFNDDTAAFAKSSGITQIFLGATSIVRGANIVMNLFIQALTGWATVIDMMFAWAGPSSSIQLFTIPIKIFFGIIMVFTIIKFLGGIIKSLPFFGG